MSGYYNRDLHKAGVEPWRAFCRDHLPVQRPPYWRAITERETSPPTNLREYLIRTFGGYANLREYFRGTSPYGNRETVREHARRMSALATPTGYAYTTWTVGAPCETCGVDC